jgi:hypothetical protein
MRLGNTVGSRINEFDSLDVQTVGMFNYLFPECPIKDADLKELVIICAPAANNCRMIIVGDKVLTHKMYSDLLYTINKEDYFLDEQEKELTEINGVAL